MQKRQLPENSTVVSVIVSENVSNSKQLQLFYVVFELQSAVENCVDITWQIIGRIHDYEDIVKKYDVQTTHMKDLRFETQHREETCPNLRAP